MRLSPVPISCLAATVLVAPALAEPPSIVADSPVVQSLVAQVTGPLADPVLLVEQGADLHDYQMRPSEARALNGADLVFWIGPEMTPWLDRVVDGGIPGKSVPLLAVDGTVLREFGDPEPHVEGHGDHAGKGHDHTGTDPHAWLDPDNAVAWLRAIADELAAVDPKNAATYAANAETAVAEVGRAEREAAAVLDRVGDKQVAVFHDAYGYFFAHFGLTEPLSLAEGDAADPGAARISEIRAALSEGTCVFPEAGHDPKLIAALAEGTGAKVAAALDPEGRGLETGAGLYAALIGGLATTIAGCAAAP